MITHPEILNKNGKANVVFLCDHASNHIPESYNNLGLRPDQMEEHITWDIGAGEMTRRLSVLIDAPAILARHSRLLIDTNRRLEDASLILDASDGHAIPGNQGLNGAEHQKRIENFYIPFHKDCDDIILSRLDTKPYILAIHTFSPVFGGISRELEFAVMWNKDKRLAEKFGRDFEAYGYKVGWNQPYSGQEFFFSLDRHAGERGLPHATLEVRNDLVRDDAGQERFAGLIANAINDICLNGI